MSKHMKAKQFSKTFYQHHLVLVPTRKSWERLCRLSLADPHAILPTGISGYVLNTEWNDGGHVIVVWIDRDPRDKSVATRAGVIAHEAAHAARMILDNIRRDREDVGSGAVLDRRHCGCAMGDAPCVEMTA